MLSHFSRRIRVPAVADRRAPSRPGRVRPVLLELEDRSVPTTTFTWLGATDGDWNLGTNWDQGTAPTTGTDVVINNATTPAFNTTVEINTLTVGNTSGLAVNGGTLTVDANSTWSGTVAIAGGTVNIGDAATDVVNVASFAMSSGTLGGPGTLDITFACNWTGGTMQGPGAAWARWNDARGQQRDADFVRDFRQGSERPNTRQRRHRNVKRGRSRRAKLSPH